MLSTINRSRTTLSIYLRSLRAVFNEAIEEKEISSDIYPFGKKRYKVPKVKNVKKALTADQLKKLFNAKPENEYQEKARAFWFFSYSCNGMNIKDIAELKWGALDGDTIVYYRAKTINTAEVIKPIIVYLNDYTISVIEKYCNDDTYPDNYIFPIISKSQSKVDQRRAIKNFTRLINQHLKKLASALELPEEISTYWARHSFATNAIRKGASMEFVSEAFNHGDLSTTKNYFAGFEEETKRELSKNLMNF
jgi:integrase/recombinase XerD